MIIFVINMRVLNKNEIDVSLLKCFLIENTNYFIKILHYQNKFLDICIFKLNLI